MRTIALEEHYATPTFLKGPGREVAERATQSRSLRPGLLDDLLDLGAGRTAKMDAAGIDVQVLSLTAPGVEQADPADAAAVARDANDTVAEAVRQHPDRFAGFAALPTPDPAAAAAELSRCVAAGFKGAMLNGHCRGRYLDDRFFWPIFESAEALGVPLYLHPAQPPQAVVDASYGGFSKDVSFMFANAGFGWHIESAVHALRLILGGVFDRFPKLQMILGHLGETLPFMIERVDIMHPALTGLKKPVSAYLRQNAHYTISGFNFTPAFLTLLLEVGIDRILFSADHPYASMATARAFLDRLPVSPGDRERIAHGNAEALLRM
jgi:predicted TIM-barrel fold metal-dependent hydrolase